MLVTPRDNKGVLLLGYYLVSLRYFILPEDFISDLQIGIHHGCHYAVDLYMGGTKHGW